MENRTNDTPDIPDTPRARTTPRLSSLLFLAAIALAVAAIAVYVVQAQREPEQTIVRPTAIPGRNELGDVVDALREQGLDVEIQPTGARAPELSRPGQALEVDDHPLYVFIYPDVASREDESDGLDPDSVELATAAGTEVPIESPHIVSGSNVIALLSGGSDETREQVDNAIEGLP